MRRSPQLSAFPLFVVALAICSTSAGCTYQNRMEADRDTPPEVEFRGLERLLEDHGSATLIFVPGMGGFFGEDPAPMLEGVGQRLGLRKDQVRQWQLDAPGGWPTRVEIPQEERVYELTLTHHRFVDDERVLHIYEADWSSLTALIKWGLRMSDTNPHRRWINEDLKQGLMNHNIADVMLYLNPQMRRVIQAPVRSAVEQIATDDEAGPIVVVSFSLGSQIVMDVLEQIWLEANEEDVSQEAGAAVETMAVLGRIDSIVMLSNQLMLLELALLEAPEAVIEDAMRATADESDGRSVAIVGDQEPPRFSPQFLERLDRTIAEYQRSDLSQHVDRRVAPEPVTVVAINDPNDLLGYRLLGDFAWVEIINVSRNVAPWAWGDAVVNPYAAHTNYGQDRRILDLMIEGYRHY